MSIDAQVTGPAVARRAREQRSQRVLAGWLATRMRAGAQARRRGARDGSAADHPAPATYGSPAPATYGSPAPATYDSLGAFVGDDPRRELRDEREVGEFWLGDGFPAAAWRAGWLPRTGELYMQRIGGVPAGGRVTVVAHFTDESTLGQRLAGWEAVAGTAGSVRWLLERLGIDDSHLPATAGAGEA